MFRIRLWLKTHCRIVGKNSRVKCQQRRLHQWRLPSPFFLHLCPVSLHRSPLPCVAGYISLSVSWTGKSGLASDSSPQLGIIPWWKTQIEISKDETHLDEADEDGEQVVENGIDEVEEEKVNENGVEEIVICPHCGMGFANESALQEHIDKTDTQKYFGGCDVLRKIRNEKLILAGRKKYICEICEQGFENIRNLRQHHRTHRNSNDFKCEECGKTYKHKASLKRHLKFFHSSDVKFACPECNKTFNSKSDMKRHLMTVCNPWEKIHECDQCNKKFADNVSLNEHIKLFHNPEHQFKCDKCKYTFATNKKLLGHIKAIHEDDRPHQCEYCSSTFKSIRDLNHHRIKKHTFDWPHNCKVCDEQGIRKGFMYPNELKKHMITHHAAVYQDQLETQMPAVCDKCNKRFSTVQQLNNHYRKVHGP